LRVARWLADNLDAKFSVGGVRFGYDSLIGLIPGIGDVATGVLALYQIYVAGRHNLGGWTIARMLGNVLLDVLIGLVPLVGDLADVAFKANRRNLALLIKAAQKQGVYDAVP
jgi:hypothetical protein